MIPLNVVENSLFIIWLVVDFAVFLSIKTDLGLRFKLPLCDE